MRYAIKLARQVNLYRIRLISSLNFRLRRSKYNVAKSFYQSLVHTNLVFETYDRSCCKMQARKLQIKKKSISTFSQLNWASQSDYVFADNFLTRQELCSSCLFLMNTKTSPVLFIDIDNLRSNSAQIQEVIKQLSDFILLIGFNENKRFSLQELFSRLPQIGRQNFVMNLQETKENFFPLPIGLRDGKELQPNNYPMSEHYYDSFDSESHGKKTEILAAFSAWTNPYREFLIDKYQHEPSIESMNLDIGEGKFRTTAGKIHPVELYSRMKMSKYVVCPAGAGFDTHRFYESILCGAIPIVELTHSSFDQIYSWFPCKVVDSLANLLAIDLQKSYSLEKRRVDDFLSNYPKLSLSIDSLIQFASTSVQ